MGGTRLLKNYNITNPDQPVNHIHYADICSVVEKMLENRSQSKVYNVVAPIHPDKQEVICAQKDLPYSGERTEKGRIISPAKLISELGFEFQYPDPRYFHL
jgi:nucleoside-diphosphate-sugar epimerase